MHDHTAHFEDTTTEDQTIAWDYSYADSGMFGPGGETGVYDHFASLGVKKGISPIIDRHGQPRGQVDGPT